jgi:hypothetical protein
MVRTRSGQDADPVCHDRTASFRDAGDGAAFFFGYGCACVFLPRVPEQDRKQEKREQEDLFHTQKVLFLLLFLKRVGMQP